jgi:hypothetical protein
VTLVSKTSTEKTSIDDFYIDMSFLDDNLDNDNETCGILFVIYNISILNACSLVQVTHFLVQISSCLSVVMPAGPVHSVDTVRLTAVKYMTFDALVEL